VVKMSRKTEESRIVDGMVAPRLGPAVIRVANGRDKPGTDNQGLS